VVLSPPTALWVVPVSDLAGVARHVLDVTRTGIPGYRLVVLCPPGPLAERLRAAGTAVTTGPVSPTDGARSSVAAVRRTLDALRPAVVHSHLSWADAVAAAATVGRDVALVTTEHGIAADDLVYHGTRWRARVKALAHTARLRRADAVISVAEATSRAVREKWHPSASTPVRLVRNGVDRPSEPPARSAGLRICSIARLAPEKRIDHLLRAFALLRSDHPEATLTLAGEGPEEAALRDLAQDLGVRGAVAFAGHTDSAAVLAGHDVLVQLSVWENCSYSLLDALVHGVGVVATPVGGNPEILPRSVLRRHDDHEAIAAEVARQGLDPAARPRLPDGWPTTAQMCDAVAAVYAEATTR
jgi:glycogen(starch) synthase